MRVLVINCGSTTLKYKLLEEARRRVEALAGDSQDIAAGYRNAVERSWERYRRHSDVIAHRVVHGGGRLPEVVRIDSGVLKVLREVTPLAPMHNGPALEGIEATLSSRATPRRCARHSLSRQPSAQRLALRTAGPGWCPKVWVSRLVSSVRHRTLCRLTGTPEPTIVTLHLGGAARPRRFFAGARWTPRWDTRHLRDS